MSFLENVLFGIGDLLFGWLIPDVEQQQQQTGRELTKAATNAYIPIVYGKRGKVPGIIIFQNTNDFDNDDVPNDLLHLIIVWCMGGVESIDQIYLDDEPITSTRFNGEGPNGEPARWAHAINFTNGMDGPAYRDELLEAAGWDPAIDKMSGLCCSYIRLEWSRSKQLFNGIPNITADITGQRINMVGEGTLAASSNNVDQLYNYLVAHPTGKRLHPSKVNFQSFRDSRPKCERQVETVKDSGVYQPLFTSNILLDTGLPVIDNVNVLLKSMRAWLPVVDGQLTLVVEEDDPLTTEVLDESNIIDINEIKKNTRNKRFNRVIVKYVDPEANWTEQEAIWPLPGSDLESEWLAEDNDILLEKTVELKTCTDYYEALRFARTFAMVSREQLRFSCVCEPIAQQFQVGDIIPVSHSTPGWNAKPFRCENVVRGQGGEVVLTLREHQPYIYDWDNTGLKPSFPDTDTVVSEPALPTNVQINPVFSSTVQLSATWESEAQEHGWFVQNLASEVISSGSVNRKSVELNGLPAGTYILGVQARWSFGRHSGWKRKQFIVEIPQTQTGANVDTQPGFTFVTPPTPATNHTYEFLVNTENDRESATNRGRGFRLEVPTEHGVTYYIWYRLVVDIGESSWVALSFVGEGQTRSQFNPEINSIFDNFGNVKEQLDQVSDDFIAANQNTSSLLDGLIVGELNKIASDLDTNLDLVEELSKQSQVIIETKEELNQALIAASAVSPTKFNIALAQIDGQEASIKLLTQSVEKFGQSTEENTAQIKIESQRIDLIQTTLNGSEFSSLGVTLDSMRNQISNQAISIQSHDANLINQIAQGLDQGFDLAESEAKAAFATVTLEALAQDFEQFSQRNEILATTANNGLAIAQQLTKTVSNQSIQFAANIESLRVEQLNQKAEINEVRQVLIDEEGNAKAAWFLTLDVNGYVSGMEALNDGTRSKLTFAFDDIEFVKRDNGDLIFGLDTETDRAFLNADLILGDGYRVTSKADIEAQETITSRLTNSNHSITTDSNGYFVLGLETAGGVFQLRKGTTPVNTDDISFSIAQQNGLNANIDATGAYTITGLTADLATAIFRAHYQGSYFDEQYTITKNKQGTQGPPGADANQPVFIFRRSTNEPATPTGSAPTGWLFGEIPSGTAPVWASIGYFTTASVLVGSWSKPEQISGNAPAVIDNGNGSYSVIGSNGSITIFDGQDGTNGTNAPIPTFTDNGDGTYTIDNGAGDTVVVSDGEDGGTPVKGVDYFDGLNGDYVSTVFIISTDGGTPNAPTGGTFNGTVEALPLGYSDVSLWAGVGIEYKSTRRYKHNTDGTWSPRSNWSTLSVHLEPAERGETGQAGAGQFSASSATGLWDDAVAAAAIPNRDPVQGDIVTIWKTDDPSIQETRIYNGTNWVPFSFRIHGDALIPGTVLADRVIANTEINSPIINGGQINGALIDLIQGDRRVRIQPGRAQMIWVGHKNTPISNHNSTNGSFVVDESGTVYVNNGVFYGSGRFDGTVYANNIEGDITDATPLVMTSSVSLNSTGPSMATIATINIPAAPMARIIKIDPMIFNADGTQLYVIVTDNQSDTFGLDHYTSESGNGRIITRTLSFNIGANQSGTYYLKARRVNTAGTASYGPQTSTTITSYSVSGTMTAVQGLS